MSDFARSASSPPSLGSSRGYLVSNPVCFLAGILLTTVLMQVNRSSESNFGSSTRVTTFKNSDWNGGLDSMEDIIIAENEELREGERSVALKNISSFNGLSAAQVSSSVPELVEPINYLRDPSHVVQTLQECKNDPTCHITYHHVSKTGGTTLEHVMFPYFHLKPEHSCCHSSVMQKFRRRLDHFCTEKYTSWQVNDEEYFEVLAACAKWAEKRNVPRRVVVWTTFREPVSAFLSYVHQMCNKNLSKRPEKVLRACRACSFDKEKNQWLRMTRIIEHQIQGAYRVAHLMDGNHFDAAARYNVSAVITMEPNDINAFYTHLTNTTMDPLANAEKTQVCSFRPSSELVKALRPAENIYRMLVAGVMKNDENKQS